MLHVFSRVLMPAALTVGLLAGCASSTPNVQGGPKPAQTLTSEDIERAPLGPSSVEQLLMDRFPGIEVRRTSTGGVSIRIRGPGSFYGSMEPLLVIDGTPIQVGPSGFSGLNPHDIATITVLKNPTETAIYGLRGANGVIVVTTKRPGGV